MKTKAVIWKPNRTNEVITPKKKEIQGRVFRHGDYVYFMDSDCQQITEQRARFWKLWKTEYYATFYYIEGMAKPAPVPHFKATVSPKLDENGKVVLDENGMPIMESTFPEIVDNGTSSEELGAIFNPWFYRILGQLGINQLKNDIQFYLTLAIAAGVGYIIWQLIKLPDEIAKALQAAPTVV